MEAVLITDSVGQTVEAVDLTPVLDALAEIQQSLFVQPVVGLVQVGVIVGCAVILVLAVMFR